MKKSLFFILPFLASATLFADDAAPARGQSMYQTFMMIGIALIFFYLILWRPEQKRRKKMNDLRKNLSKGDRVTAMGIVGTVAQIKETTLILKMVDGAKIEVLKAAISEVQPAPEKQADISSAETNGADS
jgi:preprotein translocase subunit YajC